MGEPGGSGAAVTWGLLAAWAVHDAEEAAAGPRWLRTHVPELREGFPCVPPAVWRALAGADERELRTAITLMGGAVAMASAAGARSGGDSAFYQAALTAFGLHGVGHLAMSAVVRGYTPGAVTSALVVVPFTLWARTRLRRDGRLHPTRPRDAALAAGLTAASVLTAHTLARRLLRR